MKRLFKGIILIIMVALLANVPTQYVNATTDDFNWVQWLEGNGIYSVVSMVSDGSMTAEQACLLILIPANDAGVLSDYEKKYLLNIIPKQREFWKHMA